LVCTTIIESGIDMPTVNTLVVERADLLGLGQLHQLRGRVGRGAAQSYCVLLGDTSPEAAERLALFCGTEDGFAIAQADLQLRGMGDLFGARQHGVPAFRVADPVRDEALHARAQVIAERMLQEDPTLEAPAHRALRQQLTVSHARALELFRVG
jgi:ATP-dependent DNA helicase RecG